MPDPNETDPNSTSIVGLGADELPQNLEKVEEDGPPMVMWNKKEYEVSITQFMDTGNTCIVLLNSRTGNLEARASVNLYSLPPYYTFIKDYSENRGLAEVLTAQRYIQKTGHSIRNGSEEFEQYEILPRLGDRFNLPTLAVQEPEQVDDNLSQEISHRPYDGNEVTRGGPSDGSGDIDPAA